MTYDKAVETALNQEQVALNMKKPKSKCDLAAQMNYGQCQEVYKVATPPQLQTLPVSVAEKGDIWLLSVM